MRFALASAFFLLLSACGPKTQVMTEDAVQFQTYHRLGVRAFLDKTGRGQAIADALDSKLQKAFYEPVDEKLLAKLLEQYKPDRENGFSVEGLEIIHNKVGIDALVSGRMLPDWSAAVINLVEMSSGDVVLRAVVRPEKGKVFSKPEEVADAFLHAFEKLH